MKSSTRRLLGAACALSCAVSAYAPAQSQAQSQQSQQSTQQPLLLAQTRPEALLNAVTVTASRVEQNLTEALADVTVIDAETIARSGQTSLAQLLQLEHGIEMTTTGGPQSTTSLFMRGANANQTLMLIDGMRSSSTTTGMPTLQGMPLSAIERIEIVHGPASSLYGADAIGGVINIITRKGGGAQPFLPYGSVGIGTWNTFKSNVGFTGGLPGTGGSGAWNYALQLGHEHSTGFNNVSNTASSSYNPDRDGYTRDTASGRLGYTFHPCQDVQATFFTSRMNAQYDTSKVNDDHFVQRVQTMSIQSNNRINDLWTSHLSLGQSLDDYRGLAPTQSGRITSNKTLYGWQNDLTFTPAQSVSLAAERVEEKVYSNSFPTGTPDARNTNSLTGVYRGSFGANHVQANVRGDNSTQYGSKVTGGLSYGYDIDKAWRATLGASTGFRAPTFNELYFPSFGQTSVRPESSKNIEAGLRYQANQTSASLTAYQNRVTDLIVSTTPCPVSGFGSSCAYNVNRAVLQGVGLSLMQGLGNTTLRADVDFQSPHDASTGNLLIRRAKQTAKLSAEHRLAAWVVGAEFLTTGRRYDDTANTNALGGYSLVNLFASYDIDKHWQGMLRLNNVFDKGYELARDYATPGANFFVQLSYRP
ncbi:MAG: TonB-dependent receptor [Candidatus Protistobacter heckmanni]|nr:TonB-dependent receptor [Candidatus Protistobacter heckmanni]